MYSRYVAIINNDIDLPDARELYSNAWGEVPVSHIQDDEDLNNCTYLDLKVDKWEVDRRWENIQPAEPMIRINIYRGPEVAGYMDRLSVAELPDVRGCYLVDIALDEGVADIDAELLARLARVFLAFGRCYCFGANGALTSLDQLDENELVGMAVEDLLRSYNANILQ